MITIVMRSHHLSEMINMKGRKHKLDLKKK